MDLEKFLKLAETLEKKKKGKKEELEKLQKLFERFHLLNRNYLEKEAFEKAQGSIPSISETIAGTVRYLDAEVIRLRSKRMKLPFENVELAEMQKAQTRNEMLLKEFLAQFPE
jgi:phosphopantetheinyl transferase (holo-ACP synthase)